MRIKGLLVLILGLMLNKGAYPADLYVPGSYTTIQSAINAANTGDTITVSSATYPEAIYINKPITLIADGIATITSKGLGNINTVTLGINRINRNSDHLKGELTATVDDIYQ